MLLWTHECLDPADGCVGEPLVPVEDVFVHSGEIVVCVVQESSVSGGVLFAIVECRWPEGFGSGCSACVGEVWEIASWTVCCGE